MKRIESPTRLAVLIVVVTFMAACRTTGPTGPEDVRLQGKASWYGEEFAGRPTANGEIFDPETMTAAHRTLPFGTIVDVTNLKNGRTTRVRINDRGPFVGNRIIDLSYAAARSLDMVEDGVSEVQLDIVRLGKGEREPPEPYSVKIDAEPTRPVPDVAVEPVAKAEPPPHPEPVTTIREDTVERQPPREPMAAPAETVAGPTPTPSPAPPPVRTTSGWKVQAGAFGVEDNAHRFRREIEEIVRPVYIERVGGLYRVRVGPFESRTRAIEIKERLEATGYDVIVLSPSAR